MGNICSRPFVKDDYVSTAAPPASTRYAFDKNKARITLADGSYTPGAMVLSAPSSPSKRGLAAQNSQASLFHSGSDELLEGGPLAPEESLLGLLTAPKPAPTQVGTAPFSWSKGPFLGQGAYGTVYQGLNNDTGELFAVKQMQFCTGARHFCAANCFTAPRTHACRVSSVQ